MPQNEEIPVFLINGFLESGKTQFLRFTMDQEYFQTRHSCKTSQQRINYFFHNAFIFLQKYIKICIKTRL